MKNIPIRNIPTTQKEPDLFTSFGIRDVKSLLAGKDMVQELHRHSFFFILVLKKGKGHHEIDFTSYTIRNNCVFFMRPGQVHKLTLKAGSTGYLIQFRADFGYPHGKASTDFFHKASASCIYQPPAHTFNKLLSTLTDIFQEYTHKPEGYQTAIKANLDIFFIGLARQKNQSHSKNPNPYAQERLREFLTLLERYTPGHKQVSQYAELLNLSPYQLNAITRTTLGKTCSELINEHIILESKRYLLATNNQVKEIAGYLGYEDASYFIRFFKKQTGHSPESFRRNFK